VLSASANKLSKLKKHAATYASLIMEELDPDGRGYIEVSGNEKLLFFLMQQAHTQIYAHVMSRCRFGSWRSYSVGW
jgi:hypothetical protein